jgi:hypothetical protein
MLRVMLTLLGCFLAVLAADVVFRASLLSHLHPVVLAPAEQAVLTPPVQVEWQGPERMRVRLGVTGGEQQDLGIRSSPVVLGNAVFPRDGSYQVEIEALRFGKWIKARRGFQVFVAAAVESPPAPNPTLEAAEPFDRPVGVRDLLRALRAARTAREKSHDRARFLTEENAALREESERLVQQLESLSITQENDAYHIADLERRFTQLSEENRALVQELQALRLRLSSVAVCSVWGYYSLFQPSSVPVPRRLLLVSDVRGQIFRSQPDCEIARRTDSTSGSPCFCVGTPWG